MESVRISGLEVTVDGKGEVRMGDLHIGRVGREERLGQNFWRAFPPNSEEPFKRFLTTRPEAIQLLLINADLLDGIGF